jgi:hypothetical protein
MTQLSQVLSKVQKHEVRPTRKILRSSIEPEP